MMGPVKKKIRVINLEPLEKPSLETMLIHFTVNGKVS